MSKITFRQGMSFILMAGLLISLLAVPQIAIADKKTKREEFIALRDAIKAEQLGKGQYNCCLEEPCMYCIVKTPEHGEGAACTCAQDVVTGHHPCGECMGEILEGEGAPELAPYFALALADEIGEQYLDTLKQIISDKYDIPVEEQIEKIEGK